MTPLMCTPLLLFAAAALLHCGTATQATAAPSAACGADSAAREWGTNDDGALLQVKLVLNTVAKDELGYRPAGSNLMDAVRFVAGDAKALPEAGRLCAGPLDCFDLEKRKSCPEACGAIDDLSHLVGRGTDVPKARNKIVSRLQSLCESRYKEYYGKDEEMPPWMHGALTAFDGALKAFQNPDKPTPTENPHLTDMGFPLTVVEAVLIQLNLTDFIFGPLDPHNTYTQLYLTFAQVIEQHGPTSKEAHDFYERDLYLTGRAATAIDMGWVNGYLSTLKVYATSSGIHTYRKVPKTPSGGYDLNYAVYSVADRFKIGLLSDWGSGTPQAIELARQLKKQKVDTIFHLGDTYYSGTEGEQRQFFLEPIRAVFGEKMPVLMVPGNHDYYDSGAGFFKIMDEIGQQQASYFCLRNKHWQILALDTGLLDNWNLDALLAGVTGASPEDVMTFLPDDQAQWAQHQLMVAKEDGLKTIMMSHHQLFSRSFHMGLANNWADEASTFPDRLAGTYFTNYFETKSEQLPGNLPNTSRPTVNTRLLGQFPNDMLKDVSAWFWGHEHASVIFEPYAGLKRGRCVGNSAIAEAWGTFDQYGPSDGDGTPWGGIPEVIPGSKTGHGDVFWNLGFVTIELDGKDATAEYFEMSDSWKPPMPPKWGFAKKYFSEEF